MEGAARPPIGFKSHPLYGNRFVAFCTGGSARASPGGCYAVKVSSTSVTNPLLSIEFRVPFDRIRAADVEPAVAILLREARARLEALAGPGERTFDNTMRALDLLTEPLDYAMGVVRHLESVATYPELRAAFNAVQPEVSAFYTGIPLHQELWKGIRFHAETPRRRPDRRASAVPAEDHGRVPPPRRRPWPADKKRLEEINSGELTAADHREYPRAASCQRVPGRRHGGGTRPWSSAGTADARRSGLRLRGSRRKS